MSALRREYRAEALLRAKLRRADRIERKRRERQERQARQG